MNKWLVIALSVCLLGCGVPTPPEPALPLAEETLSTEDDIVMSGAKWQIRKGDFESKDGQYLLITLSANTFSRPSMEEELYQIQQAQAVVHVPGEENSDIFFEAGKGEYVEGKRVFLEEDVQARWGDFIISLQDVAWQSGLEDTPGIIATKRPVHLEGPQWNINGSGLEMHPDTKTIVIEDVQGEFLLMDETPENGE